MTTGESLARALFALGDSPRSKCNRIQFMGGKWPHDERGQGGMVEVALAKFLDEQLAVLKACED